MSPLPLRALLGAALLAALHAVAGCGDAVVRPITSASAEDAGGDGADAGEAFAPDAGPDASAFCAGRGPIPLPGTPLCTGDLARLFRFALCACGSLSAAGVLQTASFDSTSASSSSESASVAANGQVSLFLSSSPTNNAQAIGGAVYAAGQGLAPGVPAVSLEGQSVVLHELLAGGEVSVNGAYEIGGDLSANGDVVLGANSALSVLGAVTVPAGDTAAGVVAAGGVTHGPVSVAPPCDCTHPLDVASVVSAFARDNDDAVIGWTGAALAPAPSVVSLPCGRYYVRGIQAGQLTIDVTGRVALFVDGDLTAQTGLGVNLLGPDAELDVFVAGSVNLTLAGSGTALVGDPGSPARVRLYVGGSSLQLAGAADFGLNLYAPNATVSLAARLQLRGALFAQNIQLSGDFSVLYDTSILSVGGCMASGGSCTTCSDCSGATPACKAGTCAPCTSSADCCAPLQCSAGRCALEAF